MNEKPRDCEHGQLARSCEICELKRELTEAREELAVIKSIKVSEPLSLMRLRQDAVRQNISLEQQEMLDYLDALRAHCQRVTAERDAAIEQIGYETTLIQKAEAERDALRNDAERYWKIKATATMKEKELAWVWEFAPVVASCDYPYIRNGSVDDAIDATTEGKK